MRRLLIVPAAGLGSRLRTSIPKALVPVDGRPMLDHLLARFSPWVEAAVVVAHPSFAGSIAGHVVSPPVPVTTVVQDRPTGMLDAILLATPAVHQDIDRVWTVWCDQVGVLHDTLRRLAEAEESRPDLVFPTVTSDAPYIHFSRDAAGRISGVQQRREGDAMPARGESDMGVFAMSSAVYRGTLRQYADDVAPGAGTGERNFLPFIPWLAARGQVMTIPSTDPMEAIGINTPDELDRMERWLRQRKQHA